MTGKPYIPGTCWTCDEKIDSSHTHSCGTVDKPDMVEAPPHYNTGRIEVLSFIEDQKLGAHEANVVKYTCRARHKGNELQDLKKAMFYLERKIYLLECESKGIPPLPPNKRK